MNRKFFLLFLIIFSALYSGYRYYFRFPETQSKDSADVLKKTSGLIEKDDLKIIVLPKPSGPFKVGTKPIHVQDVSRSMIHENNKRHWVIQAFYPAKPPKFTRFRPRHTFGYANQIYFASKIDDYFLEYHAEPIGSILREESGGFVEYPVIIFVPDITNIRWDYSIVCSQLASMGYVVFIWDQPYISRVVNLKYNEPIRPFWTDLWKSYKDPEFKKNILIQALKDQKDDLKWLLNNLTATLKFMYAKSNRQVILMGHGYGASIVKAVSRQYKVSGIIEYAPKDISSYESEVGSTDISKSQIPSLHIFTAVSENRPKIPYDVQSFSFEDSIIQKINNSYNAHNTVENIKAYENTILDYSYFCDIIPIVKLKPNWWLSLNHLFGNWDVLHTQGLSHQYKNIDEFYKVFFSTIEVWLKKNNLFPAHTPSPETLKILQQKAKNKS